MTIQLNDLVNRLQSSLGGNLVSVIAFGSAVVAPEHAKKADYQIMILADRLSAEDLRALRPVLNWWSAQDCAAPVLFTTTEFTNSLDVFPIEFRQMKRAYRLLAGRDVLADAEISQDSLRWQTEHELRGKMIRLRSLYPSASASPAGLLRLMTESIVSFVRLMRPLLELVGQEAPVDRLAAVKKTGDTFGVDTAPLERILRLRDEPVDLLEVETQDLFASYLRVLVHLIEAVDKI
jgi:hypothetical protein